MKMKYIWTVLLVVFTPLLAQASEAPGWDKTEAVVPKTAVAVVGTLVSCVATNEPGNRVLIVSVTPLRTLWGEEQTNQLHVTYKEFVPVYPENMSVYYANYTGSGIEWKAKPKQEYVCFLKKEKNKFSLLRFEPLANEHTILDLYKKHTR
jgi:hypothetical protein